MRTHGLDITRSGSAASASKLAPFEHFFARDSHRRHIPRKQASPVPEQEGDPQDDGEPAPLSVAAGFWLMVFGALIPSLLGWYGIFKLLAHLTRWLRRHS